MNQNMQYQSNNYFDKTGNNKYLKILLELNQKNKCKVILKKILQINSINKKRSN